jgi:Uma2 family endonuclease
MYPDAVVICEKPLFYQGRVETVLNPLLIVEVLSPSTEEYDRGEKFYLYRSLASFKEYVVVHQKHALVSAYFRLNEKDWRTEDAANLSETIHLQSIDVTLKLADIYRGIDLSVR